ncbi:MAG: hypothetical protein M0Q54_04670 [Pigmentiphaga sp.]|nr:hypothetical protein [Pigmentiphaga sp.]
MLKKIILIFFSLCVILYACEEKVENPGDFNLKSSLEIVQIYDTLGNQYPVEVLRTMDTTYHYPRITSDTLKDVHGNPLLDSNHSLQITQDTTYVAGTKTAQFVELKTILLVSDRNELHIDIQTNARWQAPTPDFGTKLAWFITQTSNGGGSASIIARISNGLPSSRRPLLANQFIFTRDSLVMYKVSFDQKGRNE